MKTQVCRISGKPLNKLFSLGEMYVSDFIPVKDKSEDYQDKVPLTLMRSDHLVQLEDTANFDKMYKRYWYKSGTNQTMKRELEDVVRASLKYTKFIEGDVWLDIGCNDGTLLKFTPREGYRIGFDPAINNAQEASVEADIVVNDYFSAEAYSCATKQKAKVITSIAMFYDLPDPNKFCRDIYEILDSNGVWVIQLSYTPLMLKQLAFDNICHEHLEYYDYKSLDYLLRKNKFHIVDCDLRDINGGSIRIYVKKDIADECLTSTQVSIAEIRMNSLRNCEQFSYDDLVYSHFFNRIEELKKETVEFITKEVVRGKTVWGYGASTKGNTLLQYYGLDKNLITGIAERQPQKWGLKTIGSEIPIYSEEDTRKAKPDYMLMLPWAFRSEFVQREQEYLKSGGKFIIPCPDFTVIGA